MGYREEGMFGFVDSYPISSGITNPTFTYPTRGIRFLEAQAALDRAQQSYKLHRGYIRNLDQPALGKDFPVSKCKFQFNPQEIRQDVSMREDVYHAILQDPAQLTQPIGAVTSFTFDLVFDRSMELAKGGPGALAVDRTANLFGETSEFDVYDIGVLADLRVLYSVIGQGFSKEMLAFQMESLKNSYEYAAANQSSASAGSPSPEIIYDDTKIKDIIEANYGNAAFLMPNPVRVLFSSLFMVDGFVTGTSVAFLKFNTNMVPMQCKVTISMSAMYIGFAKQDTFLTKNLENAAAVKAAADAETAAAKQELSTSLAKTMDKFKFATGGRPRNGADTYGEWDDPKPQYAPAWLYAIKAPISTNYTSAEAGLYRTFYTGFPSVKPIEGGYTENVNGVETRYGNDVDSILKLYESGSSPTITYNWTMSIYGLGAGATAGLSESQARTALAAKSYTSGTTFKLMGSYAGSETASSKEEWGSGTSGSGADDKKIRRRTYLTFGDVTAVLNTAQSAWIEDDHRDLPSYFMESYYIVDINISVSANVSSEASMTRTGTKSFVVNGENPIGEHKFYLNWLGNTPVIIVG
jgi:hypothetical protein